MMTAESDFLSPYLFKQSICFLLFFIFSCLPVQAEKEGGNGAVRPTDTEKSLYTVGLEDVLAIDVYDNPDLKGEYTVSINGDIVFPLLGQVSVSGMSVSAIKDTITALLEEDYLYNPIVSVIVSEYRSRKVKIMGNVGKPGIYYLDSPTRLFDLLTKAEWISPQSGTVMSGNKAHIIRNTSGGGGKKKHATIENIYIDLEQLLVTGKEDANIYLQPGDVIYIPDTNLFYVVGGVKNPGSFPYEEGVTTLKAITLAGGVTRNAFTQNAVIKRFRNGKVMEIETDMDMPLEPDDIIEVPLGF
ncbi:MAG: polysaccharide biosynthesis/export family protein [Candidatus Electrothrix sp. YB6]